MEPSGACPPECADDCPAVAAGVELELVGVGVLEGRGVSQPDHVGEVLLLGSRPPQGAVHGNRFAERRDDS